MTHEPYVHIIRSADGLRIAECEIVAGDTRINIPIVGFEYAHQHDGAGVLALKVLSHRVKISEQADGD
jgi:hypothetical protein